MKIAGGKDDCRKLVGRIAVITGGAHGIGRAIAGRFQKEGARVCLIDCDLEAGEAVVRELAGSDPSLEAMFVYADLARPEEIRAAAATIERAFGQVDILVNNAGIEAEKSFAEISAECWDMVIAVNLRAPYLLTQSVLPLFPPEGGCIINISSIHATHAFPDSTAYACSKAGLVALSRNLALELAPHHIRVNAICPGYIDTRLWYDYLRRSPDADQLEAQTSALHPLGRRGVPTDIAEAALFLATESSSFMTGTQLVLDGGLTMRAHP
jgi:NAD(P)-dependent dehydrogenase (short-subunit alcohol dehydrogenase family)